MTKKEITELSYKIVGYAIKVHKNLGTGLLENIYEKCLVHELVKNGHKVEQQRVVPIIYDDLCFETLLKIDILVDDCVVIELKTVTELSSIHKAQLLTYMKLLEVPQGLLINFFTDKITNSTIPMANEYFKCLPD